MSKDNQMPSTFSDKYAKILKEIPEFKDIADAASTEELQKIILTAEGNIYTVEKEKEIDDKLNAARELVKEYAAPYRDAIKVLQCKTKYALFLLEGKGVEVGDRDSDEA